MSLASGCFSTPGGFHGNQTVSEASGSRVKETHCEEGQRKVRGPDLSKIIIAKEKQECCVKKPEEALASPQVSSLPQGLQSREPDHSKL